MCGGLSKAGAKESDEGAGKGEVDERRMKGESSNIVAR
jgi:hypothetical protein